VLLWTSRTCQAGVRLELRAVLYREGYGVPREF
jgi:hypothetical protein